MSEPATAWPHAPLHQLSEAGTYIVTAATYLKAHHFQSEERLSVLLRGLLHLANEYGWRFEAWAVFSNHYHWVGHSPAEARTLIPMIRTLHARTAGWINRLDGTPRRNVWHNFWETRLTLSQSYLARLNYVHQNPVRHGLVSVASHYRWCSAAWFERTASPAMVRSLYRFKIDQVNVIDDYDVAPA